MKDKTGSLYYTKKTVTDGIDGSSGSVSVDVWSMDYSTETYDDVLEFEKKINEIQSDKGFMHWSNRPLVGKLKDYIKLEKRKTTISKVLNTTKK